MKKLYLLASGLVHMARHQKYVIATTTLFFVGIYIVMLITSEVKPVEKHADDYLVAKLNTKDESRFNNENTSMFDLGLLAETQKKWITRKHDDSAPYNLENPDIVDTSMGQAQRINEIFANMTNGFFIECGAYDGETRSNTLFFERHLNWNGLLIEADPRNFDKLMRKNRKAYLSNTCLSPKKHPMTTYFLMANNIGRVHVPNSESEELENTADVAHHGEHVEVQCLPLATYMAAMNIKRVDYFSLDIEGLELDVLETIPFDLFDIRALSVEYIHSDESGDKSIENMKKLMAKWGYEVDSFVIHENNLANDVIFVKKGFGKSIR